MSPFCFPPSVKHECPLPHNYCHCTILTYRSGSEFIWYDDIHRYSNHFRSDQNNWMTATNIHEFQSNNIVRTDLTKWLKFPSEKIPTITYSIPDINWNSVLPRKFPTIPGSQQVLISLLTVQLMTVPQIHSYSNITFGEIESCEAHRNDLTIL